MALIKCTECGHMISNFAEKCPQCGCPVPKDSAPDSVGTQNPESPLLRDTAAAEQAAAKMCPAEALKKICPNKKTRKLLMIAAGCVVLLAVVIGIYSAANRLTPEENAQVQQVYSQIQNIGEVGLSSNTRITAAENSFEALSTKCKRHVKNRELLAESRKQYDALRAEQVTSAIDQIGEVTLNSTSLIANANHQYSDLTAAQKKLVKNEAVLEKAQTTLDGLQVEQCAAQIDAIGTVSLESKKAITEATNLYDLLSDAQKSRVANSETLQSAYARLQELTLERCMALIDAIGTVSLDSSDAISAAESAYSDLNPDYKTKVSNYSVLEEAGKTYAQMKSDQKEADRISELRNTIRVSSVWCDSPDYAGGVDVYIRFTNTSSKTIKYITWKVTPYNGVGDIAASEIGNKKTTELSDTGPYAPGGGHGSELYWRAVWYNSTIKTIVLNEISIEYTDGSTKTISGSDVSRVID